jgi:exo-beta-1,3-glucanase (GH17 family)
MHGSQAGCIMALPGEVAQAFVLTMAGELAGSQFQHSSSPAVNWLRKGPGRSSTMSGFKAAAVLAFAFALLFTGCTFGRVTAPDGTPLQGVRLVVITDDGEVIEATTDANGRYRIRDPEGCDTFELSAPGYQPLREELCGSGPIEERDFVLQPAAPIAYRLGGIGFSPFVQPGADPNYGAVVPESEIRSLLTAVAPYTRRVRTWGCQGLDSVGRIGHELGLEVYLGAWIGRSASANDAEIGCAVAAANRGDVDAIIVGSETLLRGDASEQQLAVYIDAVQAAVTVPVGTSDVWAELIEHPSVMTTADFAGANVYGFWSGSPIEDAIPSLDSQYAQVVAAAGGVKVWITESGWPTDGQTVGAAVPSIENAERHLSEFVGWAEAKDVDYFYFNAFNEPWKVAYEGPVGGAWGVFTPAGVPIYGVEVFAGNYSPWDEPHPPPPPSGEPDIAFTFVPAYGSFENLQGTVAGVDIETHRVAVYIRVGSGWWTKPLWTAPKTFINADGSWVCDITTGGIDQQAVEIRAYLIPSDYDPPLASGASSLPEELDEVALDMAMSERAP